MNDFRDVQRELWDIRYRWFIIGIELSLSHADLTNIKERYSNDFDKCLPVMIEKWIKRKEPKATWAALVEALKEHPIQEEGVADDIEKKYISS